MSTGTDNGTTYGKEGIKEVGSLELASPRTIDVGEVGLTTQLRD